MAKDLHSFIEELERDHPDDIIRVKKTVDPAKHEITAVMELLAQQRGRHPLGLFERPLNLKGQESDIPVLINAFATRERCAYALGVPREDSKLPLSLAFSKMGLNPMPPVVIDAASAPVKQIVQTGDDIDTRELPMVTHSEGDYGPCLTMTLAIKDPESGAYNAAFIKAFYDFEDPQRLPHHDPLDRQRAGAEVLRGSRPADADRRHPRSPSRVLPRHDGSHRVRERRLLEHRQLPR